MENIVRSKRESLLNSLKENAFQEQPSARYKVKDGWVRIIRTWIHEEYDPVFMIEDCQEKLTEEEPFYEAGSLVTYIVLNSDDVATMHHATTIQCPNCND